MGVQFGSEAHEAAISKILASAKKHGKVAAIFCKAQLQVLVWFSNFYLLCVALGLNGEQAAKRFAQGFQMVSVTTDIDTLTTAFAKELTAATGKTTDAVKGYSA